MLKVPVGTGTKLRGTVRVVAIDSPTWPVPVTAPVKVTDPSPIESSMTTIAANISVILVLIVVMSVCIVVISFWMSTIVELMVVISFWISIMVVFMVMISLDNDAKARLMASILALIV